MQYKPESEKVAMMNGPYMPVRKPLLLTEDAEVQRTRKILIIILGVCLALNVAGMIAIISASGTTSHMYGAGRGSQVGSVLISILFYSFGIFVAHRYFQTGLRVFAWLCIIMLVITGILAVVLLFVAIGALTILSSADNMENTALLVGLSLIAFICILIYVADSVLTVIIVKFAFKLARLIDANKNLAIQQI